MTLDDMVFDFPFGFSTVLLNIRWEVHAGGIYSTYAPHLV